MRQTRILILAAIIAGGAVMAHAAGIKVIANPSVSVSSITAGDLKNVFLAIKSSLGDGCHVEPVLEKAGAAHETFLKTYIGKTAASLETYYRSLVFTGKAFMPKTLPDDSAVVAYVAKTKGAIAYVTADASTPGVKTLEVR